MRCATAKLGALLQPREVEAGDGLFDQLVVALRVELATNAPRRGLEREVGDLGADLLERPRRLGRDLLPRLLEPALPFGLRLLAHPLLHRLPRLTRLGEDRFALSARLGDELLVLLEQPLRLVARVVRGLDRLLYRQAPLVEHVLKRPERELPQDEEDDEEEDDRPDHQPRNDLGEWAGGCDRHLLDEHEAEEAADEAVEDDR